MFTLLKLLPIISQLSQPNISLNKEEFLAGMESVPFQVAYYGPPTRPVIRLENPTSHERLTVIFEEELNPSEVNHKWLLFSSTNLLQKPITTTASRAPLGDEVRAGKQFAAARFSNLFARSSYWGPSTKNKDGNTTENNPNAAKPQQILELTLRQTMSKVLGLKLQSAQTLTLFGFAHPAFQRPGRPKIIKLASLASRANFSPEYDEELGLYRFQWRGKSVVVPLASDQIKVNGVWKKLGEFVLQKNKETYIDPVGLDAAVGN